MKKILITGATGNVGLEVIKSLLNTQTPNTIIAGVRNIDRAKITLKDYQAIQYVRFDFENPSTFDAALDGIDTVFLLRPPHISDVDKYFKPLVESIKKQNISEVIFLSVQGADKSKVIPHNKIERLISDSGLNFIFLRPSYFMQNLTTTLINDIQERREIVLPSGKAKFNWIDIQNIGEVAAKLINNFQTYSNRAYDLTGLENENFAKVTSLINKAIKSPISYKSVNPISFYQIKKRQGFSGGLIIVMILLHFLPRFQKEPEISDFYQRVTGKKPTSLKDFINREAKRFE